MKRFITLNKNTWLSQVAIIILLLLMWQALACYVNQALLVPSPLEVLRTLSAIGQQAQSYWQVLHTVRRVLIGFTLASAIALLLSGLSYKSALIARLLSPIVTTVRALPTMAIILLAIIWLTRDSAPVLVAVLVILPMMYSALLAALREVDQKLIEMADLYKFGARKKFLHIYLPSVQLALKASAVSAIGLSVKVTVAGEIISQAKYGIGSAMLLNKIVLDSAGIIAWSLITIALSYLLERAVGALVAVGKRITLHSKY